MFKGTFSGFVFYRIGAIFAILSLIIIYWQSQYYHQEKPFPNRTISQVAQHYPEFIFIRLGTITCSVLIVLGWLTNYFVLETIAQEHSFNLKTYHTHIPLIAGTTGACLLMCSTALIDTGKMNELAHEICATSFFILTLFSQVYNTVVVSLIQGKTQAFSQLNLYVKYAISVVLFFQLIGNFGVEGSLLGGSGSGGVGDNKSNFYEWALTGTIITMFLSIGMDSNRFNFEYTETHTEIALEL